MIIYIWLYIEYEEEIEVEESRVHHHLKNHRPGTAFILTSMEQSLTHL
jgi:hypothetical protein